jgi:hypothetical protein
MAKTFQWDRFDVQQGSARPASDGLFVLAQDAINREAVLQASIRTLETQLKDRTRELEQLRAKLYG